MTVDVACYTKTNVNQAGGTFFLVLDGKVVGSHDCGEIAAGSVEFAKLTSKSLIAAGTHEIRLLITRHYTNVPHQNLRQYVDNFELSER